MGQLDEDVMQLNHYLLLFGFSFDLVSDEIAQNQSICLPFSLSGVVCCVLTITVVTAGAVIGLFLWSWLLFAEWDWTGSVGN